MFTDHAAERAARYAIALADVADAILDRHDRRRRNAGAGDWLLRSGSLVIVYAWPDRDDPSTARIITLWTEG